MQISTALVLFGSILCLCIFAWRRQWIMSLAFTFSVAYTLFDKVLLSVLPETIVVSFSFASLILLIFQIFRQFTHRNKRGIEN